MKSLKATKKKQQQQAIAKKKLESRVCAKFKSRIFILKPFALLNAS